MFNDSYAFWLVCGHVFLYARAVHFDARAVVGVWSVFFLELLMFLPGIGSGRRVSRVAFGEWLVVRVRMRDPPYLFLGGLVSVLRSMFLY